MNPGDLAQEPTPCPLCFAQGRLFAKDRCRRYLRCPGCDLIYVPSRFHLSVVDERKRYEEHDNSALNPQYRSYLETIAAHVESVARPGHRIVDFGCGRESVLTQVLRQKGIDSFAYDPLYEIGIDALTRKYDGVVMCEVIEHLRDLAGEAARIRSMLNHDSWVLVRTKLWHDGADFGQWWYAKDPTHIHFFTPCSLRRFALELGLSFHDGDEKSWALLK